jgi:hypothetical protein
VIGCTWQLTTKAILIHGNGGSTAGDIWLPFLERELTEIHQFEFREHLEGESISEVARAGEDLVDLRLVLGQPDRGLKGRPFLPLRQRLAARVGNGLLHHLGHHRAAIDFAQMLLRHVTWPEALDPGAALELVEPRREAPLKLVSADHHLQLTAQAIRSRFRDIHSASIHWFNRRLGADFLPDPIHGPPFPRNRLYFARACAKDPDTQLQTLIPAEPDGPRLTGDAPFVISGTVITLRLPRHER